MEGRFCSGFAEVCEIKKDSSSHYPQEECHPKNEDIEAHSSAKEYAKVQKRTILYIFVHLIEVPPDASLSNSPGVNQKTGCA